MANIKGNKSNILTVEVKKEVIKHYQAGETFRELSDKYLISYSAARSICLKFEENGNESLASKQGQHLMNKKHLSSRSVDPRDREIARLHKIEKEHEVLKKFIEWAEKQK